ncbi:MAG: hypothetical protein IT357_15880 [Gemmatimonadaceae bacterium]|nr:hypothetical protein [Gemmatimonadaceae bacterium]
MRHLASLVGVWVRRAGAVCAGAIIATVVSAHALAAQDREPLLVELIVPQLRSGTLFALRDGDRLLLPVRAVLSVLDIAVERARVTGVIDTATATSNAALRFVRPRDKRVITLDSAARTLTVGNTVRALTVAEFAAGDDDLLLDRALLEDAVGARLQFVPAALEVLVLDGDSLPPVAAARRRQLHARLLAVAAEEGPVEDRRGLERPLLDGGTLDYLLTLNDSRPLGESSYLTTLGASVLGGALEGIVGGDFGGRRADATGSWLGVWRDRAWLSQLRVGDGLGTGPQARTLRGVSVTNAPFLRALDYEAIPVRAAGDSAWEVESFVNGRLLRVDTLRAGQSTVPIAARYGANVVDLVARGPGGLVQRASHFVSLAATEFLRPGRVEYGVSAGSCRFTACDAAANGDLRVGLRSDLTARAGLDWQRDSTSTDVARPYAGVSWLAHPSFTALALAQLGSEVSSVMRWQPTLNRAVQLERTSLARGDPFGRAAGGAAERVAASAFWRPSWWQEAAFVNVSWRDEHADIGATERGRVAIGARTRIGQLFPFVQYDRIARPGVASFYRQAGGLSLFTTPSSRSGAWYARLWGYVNTEWRNDGSRSLDLTVAQTFSNSFRAEVSLGAQSGSGPRYGLRMYTDFPRARVITTAQHDPVNGYGGTHQVQGAVFVDPDRRVLALSRGPLLLRGAVGGRVFLDLNANGVFDADEQPLAGVNVRVGAASAASDADGWYRVWDVLPFEPVRLEVERLTLESPLWVPAFERIEIEPTPNSVRRVDVPVLSGGIVEGRVVFAGPDSTMGVGGLTLSVLDATGRVVATVTTFTDGGFVALGLAPGLYPVRLDDSPWVMRTRPSFTIRTVAEGDRVRDVLITVERRP